MFGRSDCFDSSMSFTWFMANDIKTICEWFKQVSISALSIERLTSAHQKSWGNIYTSQKLFCQEQSFNKEVYQHV